MPITPVWYNPEKTILIIEYKAPVASWAEYDAAIDEAYRMIREADHPAALIHNPGAVPMPPGSAFPHMRRAVQIAPHNLTAGVSVITNPFARNLLRAVTRIYPAQPIGGLNIVSSLEEAFQVLSKKQKNAQTG